MKVVIGQNSGRGELHHALGCARHHIIDCYTNPSNAGRAFMQMYPCSTLKSDFPQIDSVPDENSLHEATTSMGQSTRFASGSEYKASSLAEKSKNTAICCSSNAASTHFESLSENTTVVSVANARSAGNRGSSTTC